MVTEIKDSPVINLAIRGYGPFTPDAGIFCGGYQGPLYPSPPTLLTSLDLRNFMNPVMDEYTMKSTPDFYEGLGSGNPGINYRNPGHILGLLDTFSRMSYGLRVIQAARESSTDSSFDPAIDINIPFRLLGESDKEIGNINLYPALAENPTAYISKFISSNGELLLDPRVGEPYIFNSDIHSPQTNLISEEILRELFKDVLTDSYREMPQVFQNLYQQLFEYAQTNSFSTNGDVITNIIPVGTFIADLPTPLGICDGFPTKAGDAIEFLPGSNFNEGAFQTKAYVATVEESLKILGGDGEFHSGDNGVHRYDSLTELNGVVNLLPISSNAYKYKYFMDMHHPKGDGFNFFIPEWFVTYVIADIGLNIYSSAETEQQVFIDIVSRSEHLSPFTDLYYVCRQFMFSTSVTNQYTWDRTWFDYPETRTDSLVEKSFFSSSPAVFGSGPDQGIGEPFDFVTDFNVSQSVSLSPGNNTVRGRVIIQTTRLRETTGDSLFLYDDLFLTINITGDNFAPIIFNSDFVDPLTNAGFFEEFHRLNQPWRNCVAQAKGWPWGPHLCRHLLVPYIPPGPL